MNDQTTALALLRDAENYLSAQHGSVARHDHLAANLACAGCELRDRIGAALPELAAVLPATTDQTAEELASLAVNAGRALQDEKRHYEIACKEITRLRAMVDEYGDGAGALTRKLKRVRDLHRKTCPLARGEAPPGFTCGMCELLDAPAAPLRRMADETPATRTGSVDQETVSRALDALRAGNHITARRLLESAAGARQDGAQR
ncbi:hypothetical protein [Streptomyces tendae]|uniref:hypothetical protein n=1 Tax=Streptomyces tendae TaxID=1932 RepID=UPI0033FB3903